MSATPMNCTMSLHTLVAVPESSVQRSVGSRQDSSSQFSVPGSQRTLVVEMGSILRALLAERARSSLKWAGEVLGSCRASGDVSGDASGCICRSRRGPPRPRTARQAQAHERRCHSDRRPRLDDASRPNDGVRTWRSARSRRIRHREGFAADRGQRDHSARQVPAGALAERSRIRRNIRESPKPSGASAACWLASIASRSLRCASRFSLSRRRNS